MSCYVPAPQAQLIPGHAGDVWGLAWHPTKPHVLLTVNDGRRLRLWDTHKRCLLQSPQEVGLGFRACAFSTAPLAGSSHHIAIGGSEGALKVYRCPICPIIARLSAS